MKEIFKDLMNERNALVHKKFRQGLTRSESYRLASLRRKIEDLEYEQIGPHLQKLESLVKQQEDLGEDIRDFLLEVQKEQ